MSATATSTAVNAAINQSLADRLAEIVGKRRVLFRPSELLTYSSDGLPSYHKQPGLAVFPGTRDELVAEAVSAAFGVWQRQKEAAESGGQPLSFEKLIDDYVSDAHRKNPGAGCAFSALAPEIARSDKRTRALASEQVRNDLGLIAGLLPGKDKRAARSRARWMNLKHVQARIVAAAWATSNAANESEDSRPLHRLHRRAPGCTSP